MIAKLERLMEEKGLNPTRLANMAGVPQSSFHAMLKNGRKPTFEAIASVARVLAISLDYLADEGMETPPRRLSEAERQAIKMVRAMGLTEDDVIERLTQDPNAFPEFKVESKPKRKGRRA